MWADEKKDYEIRSLMFYSMTYPQWTQWISALQPFVPPIHWPCHIPHVAPDENEELLSGIPCTCRSSNLLLMVLPPEDEDADGRKVMHAKSWSVVARKEPRSETSSFVHLEPSGEPEFPVSPGVLPALFCLETCDVLRSPSPLSATDAVLTHDRPPTPPRDDGFGEFLLNVVDLSDGFC